jgi:hypothetical protein
MGKVFAIIGILLLALLGVTFTVTLHESSIREEKKSELAMFRVAPDSVDRIVIDGPGDSQARLRRQAGQWVLPGLGGFPAASAEVEVALHRLLAIDRKLPVESRPGLLEELRLGDDNFARRVTLLQGDQVLARVLLGSPQGPRHVHARIPGEDAAYAVAFGLFDAAPSDGEWIDKTALRQQKQDITAIETAGLRLVPDAGGSGWRLENGGAEESLDPAAAARLAEIVSELTIEKLLNAEEADARRAVPLARLTVTGPAGERIEYRLSKADLAEDYALDVSSRRESFGLSPYAARRLAEAARRGALLYLPGTRHHATSSQSLPAESSVQHN